ncbi:hypothetical protein BU14_0314s0003 [Porphyra umbilicalis]|uniref:Uncharacterized protein n=1 Tax=Porphyra umbilicalis TaxID=2786 RepID=A0A1X6NZQ2_PORUM|nr:hypothetical protein BU14_0314s0003 [Porphyra umbilicalis]|eukprot:OSX74000.1 hypothetical protein BU14_0314s0003 [Porphyra umbilicalis]
MDGPMRDGRRPWTRRRPTAKEAFRRRAWEKGGAGQRRGLPDPPTQRQRARCGQARARRTSHTRHEGHPACGSACTVLGGGRLAVVTLADANKTARCPIAALSKARRRIPAASAFTHAPTTKPALPPPSSTNPNLSRHSPRQPPHAHAAFAETMANHCSLSPHPPPRRAPPPPPRHAHRHRLQVGQPEPKLWVVLQRRRRRRLPHHVRGGHVDGRRHPENVERDPHGGGRGVDLGEDATLPRVGALDDPHRVARLEALAVCRGGGGDPRIGATAATGGARPRARRRPWPTLPPPGQRGRSPWRRRPPPRRGRPRRLGGDELGVNLGNRRRRDGIGRPHRVLLPLLPVGVPHEPLHVRHAAHVLVALPVHRHTHEHVAWEEALLPRHPLAGLGQTLHRHRRDEHVAELLGEAREGDAHVLQRNPHRVFRAGLDLQRVPPVLVGRLEKHVLLRREAELLAPGGVPSHVGPGRRRVAGGGGSGGGGLGEERRRRRLLFPPALGFGGGVRRRRRGGHTARRRAGAAVGGAAASGRRVFGGKHPRHDPRTGIGTGARGISTWGSCAASCSLAFSAPSTAEKKEASRRSQSRSRAPSRPDSRDASKAPSRTSPAGGGGALTSPAVTAAASSSAAVSAAALEEGASPPALPRLVASSAAPPADADAPTRRRDTAGRRRGWALAARPPPRHRPVGDATHTRAAGAAVAGRGARRAIPAGTKAGVMAGAGGLDGIARRLWTKR